MSPKFILWLIFALLCSAWYALDPDSGNPFAGTPTQTARTQAVDHRTGLAARR